MANSIPTTTVYGLSAWWSSGRSPRRPRSRRGRFDSCLRLTWRAIASCWAPWTVEMVSR